MGIVGGSFARSPNLPVSPVNPGHDSLEERRAIDFRTRTQARRGARLLFRELRSRGQCLLSSPTIQKNQPVRIFPTNIIQAGPELRGLIEEETFLETALPQSIALKIRVDTTFCM